MKKITDYKNDDAIELWADLIEPFSKIISDPKIKYEMTKKGNKPINMARQMMKLHPKEISEVLLRIDDTPIDGANAILRLVDILLEIINNKDFSAFFGFAVQEQTGNVSSGSVMESTEA